MNWAGIIVDGLLVCVYAYLYTAISLLPPLICQYTVLGERRAVESKDTRFCFYIVYDQPNIWGHSIDTLIVHGLVIVRAPVRHFAVYSIIQSTLSVFLLSRNSVRSSSFFSSPGPCLPCLISLLRVDTQQIEEGRKKPCATARPYARMEESI